MICQFYQNLGFLTAPRAPNRYRFREQSVSEHFATNPGLFWQQLKHFARIAIHNSFLSTLTLLGIFVSLSLLYHFCWTILWILQLQTIHQSENLSLILTTRTRSITVGQDIIHGSDRHISVFCQLPGCYMVIFMNALQYPNSVINISLWKNHLSHLTFRFLLSCIGNIIPTFSLVKEKMKKIKKIAC